ncbi:MAG TPA: hypothetical protein VGQ84_14645 [Gaiellaceae bacterium]|jgi:hypothetical protein|nr:hypothetical protein [Gaiellaceae bacterium]
MTARVALVVVFGLSAGPAATTTIRVRGDAEFQDAAAALRDSRGTIVLRPGSYRELVVGPRSARPLRIVGTTGVRPYAPAKDIFGRSRTAAPDLGAYEYFAPR